MPDNHESVRQQAQKQIDVDRAWEKHSRIQRAQMRWPHLIDDPRWAARSRAAWKSYARAFDALP